MSKYQHPHDPQAWTQPTTIEGRTVSEGFGVYDKRGRVYGARVALATLEFCDVTREEFQCAYRIPAGTYYAFTPIATRNGVPYGASQGTRYYRSSTERAHAVVKYFRDARKRAERAGFTG